MLSFILGTLSVLCIAGLLAQVIRKGQGELALRRQETVGLHQEIALLRESTQTAERQSLVLSERLAAQRPYLEENLRLKEQLQTLQALHAAQANVVSVLQAKLEERERGDEAKLHWIAQSEQRLSEKFDHIARRVFEETGTKTETRGRQQLLAALAPLSTQLETFHRQIHDHFTLESKERHTLTHELQKLQTLNLKLAEDAINLTNALKGDQKCQGNWGEMVLARVLETSGLRQGPEYELQVSLDSHEPGKKVQPDALIYLPQGKTVVVDSKLSLLAYERYYNAESESDRQRALQDHLFSIRSHIKQLGKKLYHQSPGLRTLDYVLLFIPIESAFSLSIQHAPELLQEAQANHLMLVSPTTLLTSLRTIHMVWRYAHQETHAKQIAQRASTLYDKFRLLMESLQTLSQSLDRAQSSYHDAMNRLCLGKGNLIRQVESFRSMGVEVKRVLPGSLLDHESLASFAAPLTEFALSPEAASRGSEHDPEPAAIDSPSTTAEAV